MATVRPFKAIRPGEGYAPQVISLPYDVMNRAEAAEMAEGKPYSFLHICRAEIDMPQQENDAHNQQGGAHAAPEFIHHIGDVAAQQNSANYNFQNRCDHACCFSHVQTLPSSSSNKNTSSIRRSK